MDPSEEDPRTEAFIRALRDGHTVDASRQAASLSWKLLYAMKRRDPRFAEAWDNALGEGSRSLSKMRPVTEAARQAFLDALAVGKTVGAASEAAGLHPSTIYKHRTADPDFAKRWDDAVSRSGNALGRGRPTSTAGEFLDALRNGKNPREAAIVAGRDVSTFYRMRHRDPDFSREWHDIARGGLGKRGLYRKRVPSAPPASLQEPETGGTDAAPAGPKGSDPSPAGPKGSGPAQGGPKGSGPAQAGPKGSGPAQADPKGSGPAQAGSKGSLPPAARRKGAGRASASRKGAGPADEEK
ncbi:MAG: hypothetical protein LBT40_02920 [Deltaproteobacteria bacterium]|jgi:hypothetical protein|nr:hypothetical protein [Deltaproteobacteria bacterium]